MTLKFTARLDPEGMLGHLHDFPSFAEQAWQMALDFQTAAGLFQVKKIVILGMGGSAIGGDLVGSLAVE